MPLQAHQARGFFRRAAVAGIAAAAMALAAIAAPAAVAGGPDNPSNGKPDGQGGDFTLTILHGNDFESQLLGVDGIEPDEAGAYGGAARHVTLWKSLRLLSWFEGSFFDKRGVISVSGGDNYLAGPELSASLEEDAPFYDALAVDRLRLDVSAIGNHEWDFGPDFYAEFIEALRGRLPLVSANLDMSAEPVMQAYVDDGTITSTTVIRQMGEKVGVIGLTTPALPTISSPRGVVVLPDLARIANAEAAQLRDNGIDKVILVSHLQGVDNETALVEELSGIDVVLAAGGGEILANDDDLLIPGDEAECCYPLYATDADGDEVPVATVTGDYKYIGKLVVRFDADGDVLTVTDRSGPVRVSGVGPDAVRKDRWTERNVEQPVTDHLEALGDTVVADSQVPLDGVRDQVRSGETNLGDLLADSLRWAGAQQAAEYGVPEPLVAVQNGGGMRNDAVIPAGPVTALDTWDVAPFSNFVSVLPEVPRDTLRQLLERGVAGAPAASGAFTQVSGLRFTYDTGQQAQVVDETTGEILTPGERVRDIVLDDGTVIVADGQVVDGAPIPLATNDFSARGGDAYPLADLDFTSVGITYQQALARYLEEGLGGQVTAADYPEGGEGRITRLD